MRCGGGTNGNFSGLLSLNVRHPDTHIFRKENIEDHYVVEKEPIARGKFASVRLARHRTTGEIFAAKFLRRRASNVEEAQHEIAVLLLGRSTPYIVHLHQVYETKTEYIIILEYGEGGDLQKLLDDKERLDEETVQGLLCQVLKGLEYLHQKNVAHLDIKPQNLILMDAGSEERIKLVDFGLSRLIRQDTELTQIMGTPDYVAPEVINFEAVGLATDMWSIGVLTYVLLSGYTPFGGDTDQETFVNITQGEFDFPPEYFDDISDQAKNFITSLLVKSTKKRPTVAQCETHPWLYDFFSPRGLSQLSEVDSVYSSDLCSGSHSFLRSRYPSDFSLDLCQISIPENDQVSSLNSPYSYMKHEHSHTLGRHREEKVEAAKVSERRPKISSAHLSINVAECLQPPRPLARPFRRSSLVIPRYANEYDPSLQSEESNSQFRVELGDSHRKYNSLRRSNHFDSSLPSNLNTWNHPQLRSSKGLGVRNQLDQFDQNSIPSTPTKPSNSLRSGNYSLAFDQLKSLPKKRNPQTNLGLRPELSCSMFELKANNEHSPTHLDFKSSNFELKKSMFDLRSSRKDLKSGGLDKSSRSELRNSNSDIRGSLFYLKGESADKKNSLSNNTGSKHNLRNSKYDLHGSRNDLKNSESDLRLYNKNKNKTAKSNLLSSHNLGSIPYLNMSLSRLDIAHETLDNEEEEKRDVVYGDYTLPHRFRRSTPKGSPLLGANSFHISFRRSKKRDHI